MLNRNDEVIWASIKYKKGITDARRGKLFSRLAKEIIVAAKNGGGDPDKNARLRTAIQIAKSANMPNDNIDRAVKRGTGEIEGITYEELTYEIYGPGGVAILVEILTDNKNRSASEIRSLLSRKDKTDEESLFSIVVDAGADDINAEANTFEIVCAPENFSQVKKAITEKEIEPELAELTFIPKSTVRVEGKDAQRVLSLVEILEDHDDVQHVYANFDIPDELLEEIA